MSLKKIQKDVDGWIRQYKVGYFKPHENLARLIEEVGEVAREINHRFGQKKKNQPRQNPTWGRKWQILFLPLSASPIPSKSTSTKALRK